MPTQADTILLLPSGRMDTNNNHCYVFFTAQQQGMEEGAFSYIVIFKQKCETLNLSELLRRFFISLEAG